MITARLGFTPLLELRNAKPVPTTATPVLRMAHVSLATRPLTSGSSTNLLVAASLAKAISIIAPQLAQPVLQHAFDALPSTTVGSALLGSTYERTICATTRVLLATTLIWRSDSAGHAHTTAIHAKLTGHASPAILPQTIALSTALQAGALPSMATSTMGQQYPLSVLLRALLAVTRRPATPARAASF